MTTQYIEPQIIFASDAPTQDKPPAFNNYAKGMDETRSNDGRPTIKQFNFIQQQNDFKFLYIHERGACLPFVEGFPYENNAVVFKDGFIQQKNGSSWVIPFMRGSQNLADLTDGSQARANLNVYSKVESLAKTDLINDLTTGGTNKALTAEQGKLLLEMFAGLKSDKGYQKLPSGLIVQWSYIALPQYDTGGNTLGTLTFPIAFPNSTLYTSPAIMNAGKSTNWGDVSVWVESTTKTTASVKMASKTIDGLQQTPIAKVLSIGW